MAYTTRKRPDDRLAPKLTKKSFTLLGEALSVVGKPFYLLLSYTLILILFTAYITGYVARNITTYLFSTFPPLISRYFREKLTLFKLNKLLKKLLKTSALKFQKISILIAKMFKASLTAVALLLVSTLSLFINVVKQILLKLKEIKSKKPLRVLSLEVRLKFAQLVSVIPKPKIPKTQFLFAVITSVFLIGFIGLYIFWFLILKELPFPKELVTRNIEVTTKIYDRNGILLYKIYKDQNRTLVPLDRIPAHVRLATISIEDAEFYKHPGFSVRGIVRAIIRNIKRGELTGGSTITQQLVKNALLTPEKTLLRKLKEIVLSVQVEFTFTKDEILEMYLNEVAYGGTAYGIQEASRTYFGKNVDQLTLGEAALLAGLPKSPTRFSPFGSNPQSAFARQKEVLHLMQVNGYLTEKQRKAAEEEKISFASNKTDIKAPHFVMYVRELLEEKYGKEVVERGGLEVITTLDYRVQKLAEEVVKEEVDNLSKLKVGNGAVIVLNTKTGEVLSMVGSKDYFDLEADGNVNVTTSLRQPGSSIKVVNYSYALSHDYTPATIIADTAVTFLTEGQPPYTPRNYDEKFRGNLPLRSALAESRNVPAVKVLASYGVDKMIEQGKKMGISTWTDPSNYGLSLTLGGGDVKLLELARVYATIANYGTRPELISVLSVKNYEGKVLEENKCIKVDQVNLVNQVGQEKLANQVNPVNKTEKNNLINSANAAEVVETALDTAEAARQTCDREQVLDPRVAFLLIDILKDNQARTPAFGSRSLLIVPGHDEAVVKTGTSNNLRDNLAIGFNQKYLVAVWVGNNDNTPMSRVASGVTGATPIWHKIITALLAKEENHEWEIPKGLVQLPICTLTESLACEGCFTQMEWFLEENKPERACNPEYIRQLKEEKEKEEREKEFEGQILEEAASTER